MRPYGISVKDYKNVRFISPLVQNLRINCVEILRKQNDRKLKMTEPTKSVKTYRGTQVQRKRTKRFIEFLKKVSAKHFDLGVVCQSETKDPQKIKLGTCGTTACAIGHLPGFNPRRFEFKFDYNYGSILDFNVKDKETYKTWFLDIAQNYFGFTEEQAMDTFSDGAGDCIYKAERQGKKVTPEMVAKRMQLILENKDYSNS